MRIIIWGMGNCMYSFMSKPGLYKRDTIIAFVDNNEKLWGKFFHNIPILAPEELSKLKYDYVIICALDETNIKKQMIEELEIAIDKIKTFRGIMEDYAQKIISKYEDDESEEIKNSISHIKKKDYQYG